MFAGSLHLTVVLTTCRLICAWLTTCVTVCPYHAFINREVSLDEN